MLLHVVKVLISFKCLRIVKEIIYDTFQAACRAWDYWKTNVSEKVLYWELHYIVQLDLLNICFSTLSVFLSLWNNDQESCMQMYEQEMDRANYDLCEQNSRII